MLKVILILLVAVSTVYSSQTDTTFDRKIRELEEHHQFQLMGIRYRIPAAYSRCKCHICLLKIDSLYASIRDRCEGEYKKSYNGIVLDYCLRNGYTLVATMSEITWDGHTMPELNLVHPEKVAWAIVTLSDTLHFYGKYIP